MHKIVKKNTICVQYLHGAFICISVCEVTEQFVHRCITVNNVHVKMLYQTSFLKCSPAEEECCLFMFSMAALREVTHASTTETPPQAIICCPPRFPNAITIL